MLIFSLKNYQASETLDYKGVYRDLNQRICMQAEQCKHSKELLDVEDQIKSTDPILWNMVCSITQSKDRFTYEHPQIYDGEIKNLRCLFILHLIMFCVDKTSSLPFHLLLTDVIDTHNGSAELIKIFNRLGVCVSYDTLLRHIQTITQLTSMQGLMHNMNDSHLTIFTMDNIDFLNSYSQVYSGNQQLSWHGTTVQAIQTKPSLSGSCCVKRSHALLSPIKDLRSPFPKRGRARTSTELSTPPSVNSNPLTYDFMSNDTIFKPNLVPLSLENFRVSGIETDQVKKFITHAISYFLLRNSESEQLIGFHTFFSYASNISEPEVGIVKYIKVMDEIADSKDTVLNIVGELHAEYIIKHNHKYLVLEGDAKTYNVIQAIKHEYGEDLSWLIPYPGDWHLLKNYQCCIMKPFFEAGLKDLANFSSYPTQSIGGCTQLKRTHRFLMEVWEALFRSMLQCFKANSNSNKVDEIVTSILSDFANTNYDELAVYSIIRSFEEQRNDFDDEFIRYVKKMADSDDTWKFWSGFVFTDCQPYISLFLAIRSENWFLRLASVKDWKKSRHHCPAVHRISSCNMYH